MSIDIKYVALMISQDEGSYLNDNGYYFKDYIIEQFGLTSGEWNELIEYLELK